MSTLSRNLSLRARKAFFAQQTDECPLICLEIDHADLAEPIRVVNNFESITSNGNEYVGFPFRCRLPSESDQISRVTLEIDNVSREIVQSIRQLATAPTVAMFVILADTPDVIEAGPFYFTLRHTRYDFELVSGELTHEDLLNEPYPADIMSPGNFPNLW